MEQEIERRVVSMTAATKENIEKETGISSSFNDEDIRKYLQEVLQEIGSRRKKRP
jgi:hypothetical protein